jgi:hypothetical protein
VYAALRDQITAHLFTASVPPTRTNGP